MVAVGWKWHRADRRVGKSRGRGGGRSRPRPWDSRRSCISSGRWPRGPAGPESIIYSGGALPVAVAVRRCVVNDGGTGVPSNAETDTVEPAVAAESVSCVELLDRGVGCAIVAAAARASVEPVPPSWIYKKPKRIRHQRQAKSTRGRYSLRWWRRRQEHERRISPGEQKGRQSLYVARVRKT